MRAPQAAVRTVSAGQSPVLTVVVRHCAATEAENWAAPTMSKTPRSESRLMPPDRRATITRQSGRLAAGSRMPGRFARTGLGASRARRGTVKAAARRTGSLALSLSHVVRPESPVPISSQDGKVHALPLLVEEESRWRSTGERGARGPPSANWCERWREPAYDGSFAASPTCTQRRTPTKRGNR